MMAVIVASTAALLGTSEEPAEAPDLSVPSYRTTYTFERNAIDGGSADLTQDQPRVTYYVNLRVDDYGPNGVTSSDGATALVRGTVSSDVVAPSAVDFTVSTQGNHYTSPPGSTHTVGLPLSFTGNCSNPTQGAACATRFAVELARSDDGVGGGIVHVEWSFDVSSTTSVPNEKESSTIGPSDPPWTIEVTR